jgi:uncharacterized protein (TIGR02145 family)
MNHVSLHAQVTIGGLENPKPGAILDLNSTVKGGLLLSNVDLPNFYTIPNEFGASVDKNKLVGAMIYNRGQVTSPSGVYVWNGTNWTPMGENCLPLNQLNLTPSGIILATTGDRVTLSVSSDASSRCAEDERYDWYLEKNGGGYDPAFETDSRQSIQEIHFPSSGIYRVKVEAKNCYADYGGAASMLESEVTVSVTDDGTPHPGLFNGNYSISGGFCYDLKGSKKPGESGEAYNARNDDFSEGNLTKTYTFYHSEAYSNLVVFISSNIVKSVSQPAVTSNTGSGSTEFTVTFKDDVKSLVASSGGTVALTLWVRYEDSSNQYRWAFKTVKVQDAVCGCPARISTSPEKWLTFMCRNLGATYDVASEEDIKSIIPVNYRAYHGDWYRFGVSEASMTNIPENDGYNDASAWSSKPIYKVAGDWPVDSIPCPAGWRLPTSEEWAAVINWEWNGSYYVASSSTNNNELTKIPDPAQDPWDMGEIANFLKIGDYLYLPATGNRIPANGSIFQLGHGGYYWSSTATSSESNRGWRIGINGIGGDGNWNLVNEVRTYAFPVRCVQKE